MTFVTLNDVGREHDLMEVLLCDAHKHGKFIFKTCVRADWEQPRGSFYKEYCFILDLDLSKGGSQAFVFRSSSSALITELRGQEITRQNRLRLLLGYEVILPNGWTIRPS